MSFRIFFLAGLLLLFTVYFSLAAESVAVKHGPYRAVSELGNLYELTTTAPALETMKPLPVTVSVTNSAGAPVAGGKLSCSLTMPAMAMPGNRPPLKESAQPGRYTGIFLLTMGGLWNVEISLVSSTGVHDSVIVPIAAVAKTQDQDSVDAQLENLFHNQNKAQ